VCSKVPEKGEGELKGGKSDRLRGGDACNKDMPVGEAISLVLWEKKGHHAKTKCLQGGTTMRGAQSRGAQLYRLLEPAGGKRFGLGERWGGTQGQSAGQRYGGAWMNLWESQL